MKAGEVSALREGGLRRACGAEPPGCEPPRKCPFKQQERKADTMKTYLLKTPAIVEPKARLKKSAARPRPAPTSLADISSRCSQPRVEPAGGPVLFIGLDVHTESIAVSIAPGG